MAPSQETVNTLSREVVALTGQCKGLRKDIEELGKLVKGESPDKSLVVRAVRNEDRLGRLEEDLEEHVILCLSDKKTTSNRIWGFLIQNSPSLLLVIYLLIKGI